MFGTITVEVLSISKENGFIRRELEITDDVSKCFNNNYQLLHCTVLYCIVLYCIALYCIVLYCIVLYCIVLYCIVLFFVHRKVTQ